MNVVGTIIVLFFGVLVSGLILRWLLGLNEIINNQKKIIEQNEEFKKLLSQPKQ